MILSSGHLRRIFRCGTDGPGHRKTVVKDTLARPARPVLTLCVMAQIPFAQARRRAHGLKCRQTGNGLLPAMLAGALLCAACSERPVQPLCQERTRNCLNIDTEDVEIGGSEFFEVRLTNVCRADIEYKLCFEVPGEEAGCRQKTLATTERADERIALARFGGRTRIFVRRASEAKACRFPLTRDVEF